MSSEVTTASEFRSKTVSICYTSSRCSPNANPCRNLFRRQRIHHLIQCFIFQTYVAVAEAFKQCAKFYYSITITLSAVNIMPVRCAAEYLGMTEDVDRGNFVSKLDVFLKSCILHRWKDTLVTLQSTK